jgi:protocatechuate 3,4-dioxygenase beta subunit
MAKHLTPTAATEENHSHSPAPTAQTTFGTTRRGMLTASAALAGAAFAGGMSPAFAEAARRPTSEQVLGPFFPITLPVDQDADLTVINGKSGRALGQIVYVSGRVTNVRGEPVANAELEIWQANSVGRYSHPGDQGSPPLDPNFEGYAKIRTGADGNYSFKTIKPAAYPAGAGWTRPPHIHFDIKGRASRLVTQMYFAGEALNEKDKLFLSASTEGRKSLLARYEAPSGKQERDALVAVWDVVLSFG